MTSRLMNHVTTSIHELFVSIQGEGSEVGMKAVFVRFSGCNLECNFCDTKKATEDYIVISTKSIVDYIVRSTTYNVIFTGGEPTLQMDAINDIMNQLGDEYNFYIETNGTNVIDTTGFKGITISPKESIDYTLWNKVYHPDIITWKYVVDSDNIDNIISEIGFRNMDNVYLMPKGVTPEELSINTSLILDKIEKINTVAKLGLRLHILMGMR